MPKPIPKEYFPHDHLLPENISAAAVELIDDGARLNISLDSPEIGLVTLSYDAGINEWNLDGGGLEKTLVVPEAAFRRAAANYLKGE